MDRFKRIACQYRTKIFPLLILASFLFANVSQAQTDGRNFGLGLILGSPTGFSVKTWMNSQTAWSGGLAWSVRSDEDLHLHLDFLWHNHDTIDEPGAAFYYGIGGRLGLGSDARLGARVPVGITYVFEDDPFDVFLELAPVLDVVPATEFSLQGGIGARYYFNRTRD